MSPGEPLPGPVDPIKRLRWATAAATGPVISGPGVLYAARLTSMVAGSPECMVRLRDHASDVEDTGLVLLGLHALAELPADDWPKAPVALRFQRGITVEFVAGTGVLTLGWDVV